MVFTLRRNLSIFIVLSISYLIFITSCANTGMPSGGPTDSIPPVVVKTIPLMNATKVKAKEVRVTFNEYFQMNNLNEKLVVSPPMKKKPILKTKAKILILEFKEDLRDSTTYTFDFKDGIGDNNEKNLMEDLRLSFSTGPVLDTFRVGGFVRNAFTMVPEEKITIAIYSNLSDTAVTHTIPDYIAQTNEEGFFLITNIPQKHYQLFAFNDMNSDLQFSSGEESVAFIDSLIFPDATFIAVADTIVKGLDTIALSGQTIFKPDLIFLHTFQEIIYEQFLDKAERKSRNNISFSFNEGVGDEFKINPVNFKPAGDWQLLEFSKNRDSILCWITDTGVIAMDTMFVDVTYLKKDSLEQWLPSGDTLEFYFEEEIVSKKKKMKKKEEEPVKMLNVSLNTKSNFDLYSDLIIISEEPVASIHPEMIHITMKEDSILTPVEFTFRADTMTSRKFFLSTPWDEQRTYEIEIDSAAITSIYGQQNDLISKNFTTQKESYYGTIYVNLQNVTEPVIVQVLKTGKNENLIKQLSTDKPETLKFAYLKPGKYILKLIFDSNNNGQWDTGNLAQKQHAERIMYYPTELEVKSNWDVEEEWVVQYDVKAAKEVNIDKKENKKKSSRR